MAKKSAPSAVTSAAGSPEPATTQRAYTLRLRGVDPGDTAWRDALWATHEAINKGAKAFGDWLLTLRGGLDHALADAKVIEGTGTKKSNRDPNHEERRDRRILLALSWLSVESAPLCDDPRTPYLVVCGKDVRTTAESGLANRELTLREALRAILRKRGVDDTEIGDPRLEPEDPKNKNTWLSDCGPSLAARFRDDAVWVNRSMMFDSATTDWNTQAARKDAHTLLSFILSADFLVLPTAKKTSKDGDGADESGEQEERQKAVKASSKGAGQRTRHPFSHLLGAGNPFGKPTRALELRGNWRGHLESQLSSTNIPLPSVETSKTKKKDDGPAHTELLREMFSKAASRVAQIVTKQRQQEADRLARKDADKELSAMEIDASYKSAITALATYCEEYRVTSGATGEFRIRPGQITGWPGIVKRWSAIKTSDANAAWEARIQAAKDAIEADEEKKPGDINLFSRLAEERFSDVWRRDGKTYDATILQRFVKGMKARSDSERLKVAAYRHPDPYRNPIFCQFGVSRPTIQFRRIRAFTKDATGNDPRAVGMLLWHPKANSAKLTVMHGVSRRLDNEIGSACDAVQLNPETVPGVSRRGRLGAAAAGLQSSDSPSRVSGVFDLKEVKSRPADDDDEGESSDRKLKEPKWNGTLSANRRDLASIQRLRDDAAKELNGATKRELLAKVEHRRGQLRWTLTVSIEMEGRGPWLRYVIKAPDQTPFKRTTKKDQPNDRNDHTKGLKRKKGGILIDAQGWPWDEFNKPLKDSKDGSALEVDKKATRGDRACLILSRLPGLRTLSVDLGHRFAAGCAVWEALTLADFKKEIAGRAVVGGGTGKHHLFVHTRHADPKTGKDRTTVYRRVGPDKLPNGSEHPAPWARLDRQFLIKLQGEEKPARAATNGTMKDGSPTAINEVGLVADLAKGLGLLRGNADERTGRGVDELMRRAVGVATLGLKRHARRAKIAYALSPECNGIPGMGDSLKIITRGDEEHARFLTGALADWHALATDTDWDGSHARELWNTHVKPLTHGFPIGTPAQPDPNAEAPTRQQRRKATDAFRDEKIKPIAEHLAKLPASATKSMHDAWAKRWKSDDGLERTKDDFAHTPVKNSTGKIVGSTTAPKKGKESAKGMGGWHARLRLLTDWLMGRHLPGQESKRWNRNVGGLSLTRISTLRSLYQLHKAFAMRPTPDKVQGAPKFGESNTGIAQGILDTMERMREQRVKQLASRIAEAALGIGRIPSEQLAAGAARPTFQKDKPCHAVVIESLRNYRPDELQTRRENKALMEWSSGKVRKYLEEACQLHGLHLREVQPNYTSRQCSRTGLPGIRCVDVPVDPKTGEVKAYWWKKTLASARKKIAEGKRDSEARFLIALADHLAELKAKGKRLPQTVRVPRKGGDLFLAAPPDEAHGLANRATSKALQADLNAAANIGLRALLDPDFPGRWWYVPASIDKGRRVPAAKSCTGAACLAGWGVAPDGKYYSSQGQALTAANEDDVTRAETTFAEAKKAWDAAKKAMKKSKIGGDEASHPHKLAFDAAKAALDEAKKSATQKEIINLWQDPQADRPANAPSAGRWRESGNYWAWVRQRAVRALWNANGLASELASDAEE